jgi:hypothetical protein
MIIYLGSRLLESTSDLPGSLGRAVLTPLRGTLPYVVLLQAGFSKHPASRPGLVGSYPTVSPFPLKRGGLLFCGTVHGVAPCPVSGPPCPAELGLSSPRCRGAITSPALNSKNNLKLEISKFIKPFGPVYIFQFPIINFRFFHLSPYSQAHPLLCSAPSVYILPLHARSSQSIPWPSGTAALVPRFSPCTDRSTVSP